MRLQVDKENTLYFRLDEKTIIESEEVRPGIILDYDEDGKVVGIEMLATSTRVAPNHLRVLQIETA